MKRKKVIKNNNIENFLRDWNNTFPFDKWYRDRYKIGFLSEEHLNLSQIDIFLEWKETQLFSRYFEEIQLKEKKEQDYKQGILLQENQVLNNQQLEDLWDEMSLDKFE